MATEQEPHAIEGTRLLTPAAVAAELNISLDTVYNLIRAGDIQAVSLAPSDKPRLKGLYRIRREWIDEFVTRRLVVGSSQPQEPCVTRRRSRRSRGSRVIHPVPDYFAQE
ncbi:MAG: helix-turn-helix domain-containing protein [Phycisphaerales bacterium]